MKAILLVAGYATRLYPLTKDYPKALLSVGGKPMLSHLVEQLDAIPEIDRIYIVSNHRFYPQFAAWARDLHDGRLCVLDDGTTQDGAKLGAIGDIEFVRQSCAIDEDVLIVAGDNYLRIDFGAYYQSYLDHGRSSLLLAQRIDDRDTLRRFAVAVLDGGGRVMSLVEKPQNPPSNLGVFALYLYPREVFSLIPQYLQEGNSADSPGNFPVWLHSRQPVYAYVTDSPCYDIGTPESLQLVRRLYGE